MHLEQKFLRVLLVGLFFVGMFFPFIDTIFDVDKTVIDENRNLASKPRLNWTTEALSEYSTRYEKWYDDHLGFRPTMIQALSRIRVKGFGVSSNKDVVLGKDGWLYYVRPDPAQVLQGFPTLEIEELEYLREYFEQRENRLKAKGIPYVLVIVPAKHHIYPEYLPRMYQRVSPEGSRLDQFLAYMEEHSTTNVIDLRSALATQKEQENDYYLYYKTDSHWTEIGGFAGAEEVADRIRPMLPAVAPPLDLSAFSVAITEQDHGHDMSRLVGLYKDLPEGWVTLVPHNGFNAQVVENPDIVRSYDYPSIREPIVMRRPETALPTAVMFRDSFGTAMIPFLSEHFSRIVYYWQHIIDDDIIEKEKPDIVIQEIVDRVPENILENWHQEQDNRPE